MKRARKFSRAEWQSAQVQSPLLGPKLSLEHSKNPLMQVRALVFVLSILAVSTILNQAKALSATTQN